MKRDTLEWLACMLVATIGLVGCLWVVPYIPTPDGPQHVFSAHVENHFADAGSAYPDYYRIEPQFGAKGFALVFGPLESMLPWRVALRVALSLMAVAFAWGFGLVALALGRSRRPTALLGFVIALPWSLYMGFFPFVIGATFGLYVLAYAIHRPPTTTSRGALLSFFLLLEGVCHVFTAVMTGVVVAALLVLGAPSGRRLAALGRMVVIGVPAAALLGATFVHRNIGAADSGIEWELASRAGEISRWFVAGPSFRGWVVIGLVLVGIGTTLARSRRAGDASSASVRPGVAPDAAIAWVALAFLLVTMFGPIHIPGWQLFAPRFAVLATVLGLALLRPPERASPRVVRALTAVVTVCCIGSNVLSAKLHHRLANGCADLLAALDVPLHFEGPRWPVLLNAYCGAPEARAESPVPWAAMALNVNLLYLLDHGGIAAKLFNGAPSIHAISVRGARMPLPPPPYAQSVAVSRYFNEDPKIRASALTELAADGMRYEGIHVVGGRPDDFTVFKDRGYRPEFENDSMLIARFEGCPSELILPPDALDKEPVYFEYGLFSRFLMSAEPHALFKMPIARDTPVIDGAIHVALPGRPCGAIWVRVVWDADGSLSLTPGDRSCAKAPWKGRRIGTVSRDHLAIQCAPEASPP
jgi:hypothetical protein